MGEERLPELSSLSARVATQAAPFELGLEALGVFPSTVRPQVVWVGVGRGSQPLAGLAEALGDALREAGWGLEHRPFRAHCTLARLSRPPAPATRAALEAELVRGLGSPGARFSVAEIALVESVPSPGGAHRYPARQAWSLGLG